MMNETNEPSNPDEPNVVRFDDGDPVHQAVQIVLDRYNSESDRRLDNAESGAVFWLGENGRVRLGEIRWGQGTDQVTPYNDQDRDAIAHEPQTYLGDFHTHTTVAILWTASFPSVHDLQFESALCDYWHLTKPVPERKELKCAPLFQLVQSLWFGDVFVIKPAKSRIAYESPEKQILDIGKLMMHFQALTSRHDLSLGDYDTETSHDEFLRIAKTWVDEVNGLLGARCEISILPNNAFCEPTLADEQ